MASRLTVARLNLNKRGRFVRLMHSFEWSSIFHKAHRPVIWLFSLQMQYSQSSKARTEAHRVAGVSVLRSKSLNKSTMRHGLQHVKPLRPSRE